MFKIIIYIIFLYNSDSEIYDQYMIVITVICDIILLSFLLNFNKEN